MASNYKRAGLTSAEIRHLASLISNAESSDPSVPWIAVPRADVMSVVAVLDRFVDGGVTAPSTTRRRGARKASRTSGQGDARW